MKQKTLVVANWKMNPPTLADATKLFLHIKKRAPKYHNVQTIICPPLLYIAELKKLLSGKSILLGAQDVFWRRKGAYTGEVSAPMLIGMGVSHVIIGHSERRALGETNENVVKKMRAVLGEGLVVILCVGERQRDGHGEYLSFMREQLLSALAEVSKRDLGRIVIAYEPIWAIGKSDEDSLMPDDMHQMSLYIKKILVERYEKELALSVPILYGGSAERKNSGALLADGEIDGLLVGHASLKPEEFIEILEIANKNYAAS